MTHNDTPLTEREEIEAMLTWYAMGKLDPSDRKRVESWLARDAGLARQLVLIEDDRIAAVHANEARKLPPSLTVEAAMKAATGKPSHARSASIGLIAYIRDFFSAPTAMGVRFATAAAAAVILLQAAWLGTLLVDRGPSHYQTASGGGTAITDGTFALVRFADTASAKDVADTLQKLAITIVDGPRPGALFHVRIGAKAMATADRDARLAALRAEKSIVVLATPASEK